MKLIFCLWIVFIVLIFQILSKNAHASENFTVLVHTLNGEIKYSVRAPSDSTALDSVVVGTIYNKRLGKFSDATVLETGLSTLDLPTREFFIKTDDKSYSLFLNIVNPEYVMTAIQASKYLMSKTSTRDITNRYDGTTLKSRTAHKIILKLKSRELPFLLNTEDIEQAKTAFRLAAQVSKFREEFVEVKVPAIKVPMNCGKSIFSYGLAAPGG